VRHPQAQSANAGVVFREEAARLEERLLGDSGTKNGYQVAANSHG
jgi:hypothetical protein